MWDYSITGFESLVNRIRSAACMLRDRIDTFTSTRVTRRVVNQPISRWLVADQSCRSESEMYFDPFAPIGIAPSMAWLIEDSRLVSAYWTREKWLQSACSVYRVKRNESTSIHIFPVTWVFFCVFNFLRMLLLWGTVIASKSLMTPLVVIACKLPPLRPMSYQVWYAMRPDHLPRFK